MTDVICVPLKLDAFVVNPTECRRFPLPTLAPLAQPNHSLLRVDQSDVKSDILPHVDLHLAGRLNTNTRLTDVSTGALKENRIGVHLHWSLPRHYRSSADSSGHDNAASHDGLNLCQERRRWENEGYTASDDTGSAGYRRPPNRWLVIRHMDYSSIQPAEARTAVDNHGPFAWVIESDRIVDVDELTESDLQLDASPFVDNVRDRSVDGQSEVFIGKKVPYTDWRETRGQPGHRHVDLSTMASANSLFADYVPHNGNVFSMFDDFTISNTDAEGKETVIKAIRAIANYQVIGWHADESDDPLFINPSTIRPADGSGPTHQTRFEGCKIKIKEIPPRFKEQRDWDAWLNSSTPVESLCHGSLYEVRYSSADWTPGKARSAAEMLHAPSGLTIAPNPLDALLSLMSAHNGQLTSKGVYPSDIAALQQHLLNHDPNVDSQVAARDELVALNFAHSANSGSRWSFSGEHTSLDDQPKELAELLRRELRDLNDLQDAADELGRDVQSAQWELFCIWWRISSGAAGSEPASEKDNVQAWTKILESRRRKLAELTYKIKQRTPGGEVHVENPLWPLRVEKKARLRFQAARSPTVLVAGLSSPWPHDFLDALCVRFAEQLQTKNQESQDNPHRWPAVRRFSEWTRQGSTLHGLRSSLRATLADLVDEFMVLRALSSDPRTKPTNGVPPLYHDDDPRHSGHLRDRWDVFQPWFPLFVEWEVKYHHVPWKMWSADQVWDADIHGNSITDYKYVLSSDVRGIHGAEEMEDTKRLSGRVVLLPQASYSLAAVLQQTFNSVPQDALPDMLKTPAQREEFLKKAERLPYLSMPLSGLSDDLVTLIKGAHIQPTAPNAQGAHDPLPAGVFNEQGLTPDVVSSIGAQTDAVPYGTEGPVENPIFNPFKPVTHGQLMFTKFNIIDKFGQAISAVDPSLSASPTKIYPALSKAYQPRRLNPDESGSAVPEPNTVTASTDPPGHNQCVQLPPTLNQEARINAEFLIRQALAENATYHTASEWDNPVWGWLVVNYMDHGLQFFLPDGQFYRQVRLNQDDTGESSPLWSPFPPPKTPVTQHPDLDTFIAKCNEPHVIRDLIASVMETLDDIRHAPPQYAEYMSAIIGRPLALVTTGWSLELAKEPLKNRSTLRPTKEGDTLTSVVDYEFKLKIGDQNRVYDGFVGMFPPASAYDPSDACSPFDSMFTYAPHGQFAKSMDPVSAAETDTHVVRLRPYKAQTDEISTPADLSAFHTAQFQVRAVLMDPYSPIVGHSGILPPKSLALPAWTIHTALRRITAFFRLGPLLVNQPPPPFNQTIPLDPDQTEYLRNTERKVELGSGVPIPAINSADAVFLQPYFYQGPVGTGAPLFSPLNIEQVHTDARFDARTKHAIEGYLQLRQPLEAIARGKGVS